MKNRLASSKIAKLITTDKYPKGMSNYFTNHYKNGSVTAKVIIPRGISDEQLAQVAIKSGALSFLQGRKEGCLYHGVIFYFRKEQKMVRKVEQV